MGLPSPAPFRVSIVLQLKGFAVVSVVLVMCLVGGIIFGAHFIAAAIELAANRKQTKAEQAAQKISDLAREIQAEKVVIADQRHSTREPHAFDPMQFFHAGRR